MTPLAIIDNLPATFVTPCLTPSLISLRSAPLLPWYEAEVPVSLLKYISDEIPVEPSNLEELLDPTFSCKNTQQTLFTFFSVCYLS